jgi:hypothetical protein
VRSFLDVPGASPGFDMPCFSRALEDLAFPDRGMTSWLALDRGHHYARGLRVLYVNHTRRDQVMYVGPCACVWDMYILIPSEEYIQWYRFGCTTICRYIQTSITNPR